VALHRLAQEDPSFRVHTDEESGQTIISGMGELHLEIIVDRMKREFGVEANVGAPQVAYREAMRKSVEQEGKFIRQSGGRGQYGHVKLRLDPQPPGKVIRSEVPLAEMFQYSTQLRSLTQGRATYTMEFKHYSEAPKTVADGVISKITGKDEKK